MSKLFLVWSFISLLSVCEQLYAQSDVPSPIAYLPDSSGKRTLAEVWQLQSYFKPLQQNRVSFGVGQPPIWFRVKVSNSTTQSQHYVVTIDNALLDDVRFYILTGQGKQLAASEPLGWAVTFHNQQINNRYPAFRFSIPPGQERWVLTRVSGFSLPLVMSLEVKAERIYIQEDRHERLFGYWLLGIISWLVLVSIMLALLLREPLYGYYGLYAFSVCAYLMANKGFWFEWFPAVRYGPVPARFLPALLTYCLSLSGFLFIRQYTLLSVWNQIWVRRLFYLSLLPLIFNCLLVIFESKIHWFYVREIRWMAPLISSFSLGSILLMFGLLLWRGWQERLAGVDTIWRSPAQLYILGVIPLVLHTITSILHNYAIIHNYPFSRFEGYALGYLFEFLLLSIGLAYRYKELSNQRHRLLQEMLQQQLHLQREQNHALQAQLRVQQEKERIARDLHDNVGSQLLVIAFGLEDHIQTAKAINGSANHLETIRSHTREAIESLRETIWATHNEYLTIDEFRLKLQQYLKRQQELVHTCTFQLQTDLSPTGRFGRTKLSSEQALNLFRIIQEAVQNAVRHARSSQIVVRLQGDERSGLTLWVEDNGVGFDTSANHPGHYGLPNMQHRIEHLGGTWSIQSITGLGTTIGLTLPLEN